MAPLKRNQKTQLSLLHFAKRNAVAPTTTQPPPKPKIPLRTTPRPTAPPFFKAPLPKPSPPKYSLSVADDAWEVADRFMKGQRLTPKKRAFEDNAPVLQDSDDDDFESDIVTQRNFRQRSSTKSTTPLRDDRVSMTKRSANKSNRSEPVGRIPTQQRSVFEDYGLAPKMTSRSSSEDEDDDNHVVVFEGEKSSLSGTDNEDERGIGEMDLDKDPVESSPSENDLGTPSARLREKEPPPRAQPWDECGVNDLDLDQVTEKQPNPGRSSIPLVNSQESDLGSPVAISLRETEPPHNTNRSDPEPCPEAAKAKSPFPSAAELRVISSRVQEPRTVGLRKCSTGSDDVLETHPLEHSPPRRRKIRPLFNSDTDESDSEKYVCRERRRRSRLKCLVTSPPPSLSSEDSLDDQVASRPQETVHHQTRDSRTKDSDGLRSSEDLQDVESSDVEIVSTPKARGKDSNSSPGSSTRRKNHHTKTRGEQFVSGKLQSNRYESPIRTPLRTPRNKNNDNCGTDERRASISDYIATVSPSLSPPSKVKKRRRFRRLLVSHSSEDEQDMDRVGQDSTRKVQSKRLRGSQVATPEACSGTPKSAEWFHERDIDEFSDSSSDTRPTPRRSYVTRSVTRRRRRLTRGSPRIRQPVLPVKRNISKSFDLSPDQRRSNGTQRTCSPTSHGQGSGLRVRDSTDEDQDEITRNAEPEVIDLVGEDEEPAIASNDVDKSPEIECSVSSGGGDKIKSAEFDDDAPPPFNLIALCKDGESIRQMKERLGEELVMDKVTEAQENGREIVGGEELGLTGSYNKSVFDRFSRTVVADQLGKERASKSVTEQALRGEYKFHYRGRPKDSATGKQQGSSRRQNARGRFAKYRRRRGAA